MLAELALFSVLYSDGMKVGFRDLRRAWRLPGRALLLGLPITLLLTAVAAHYIVGLDWLPSLLLGAVLSPTDPVFAAAIVGREEVPGRLRHLLNVESGLNDGLALPIVLVLLAASGGAEASGWGLAWELGLGVAIGLVVPLLVLSLERLPFLAATKGLQPLLPAAIGLLVLGLCLTTNGNLFLAAFAAGITVASFAPEFRHEFEQLGELVAEQLKLLAILVFGALITPASCSRRRRGRAGSSLSLPWSSSDHWRCSSRWPAQDWRCASRRQPCGSGPRDSPPSSTASWCSAPASRTPMCCST